MAIDLTSTGHFINLLDLSILQNFTDCGLGACIILFYCSEYEKMTTEDSVTYSNLLFAGMKETRKPKMAKSLG